MKRVREFLQEIYRRDRALALTGWFHAALVVIMLCLAPFDSRTVMGVNPWLKPIKFALSITIYLWTLAWFQGYLRESNRAKQVIRWGAALAMIIEIICISLQAGRGVTSHYNVATAFDGAIFSMMGAMIFVNTLLAVLLLILFRTQPDGLATAYLWGIRCGIFLFIAGSLIGMIMIANGAHTVGLPDGGPGLAFVNWSTEAGDLRVAHLVGLHAFQILPLLGYTVSRKLGHLAVSRQLMTLGGAALVYIAVFLFVFRQALSARPLLAL